MLFEEVLAEIFNLIDDVIVIPLGIAIVFMTVQLCFKIVFPVDRGRSFGTFREEQEEKESLFLLDSLSTVIKNVRIERNGGAIKVLDDLINRYELALIGYSKIFMVEDKKIRKQNRDYFEVACYQEYKSLSVLLGLVRKGVPLYHANSLELMNVIIDGLEYKYEKFVHLSLEDIVEETKMLKELLKRERDSENV